MWWTQIHQSLSNWIFRISQREIERPNTALMGTTPNLLGNMQEEDRHVFFFLYIYQQNSILSMDPIQLQAVTELDKQYYKYP